MEEKRVTEVHIEGMDDVHQLEKNQFLIERNLPN